MDFTIKTGQPEKQRTDCLVLPVFEPGKLDELTVVFDTHCDGAVKNLVKMGDMNGQLGSSATIHTPTSQIARVILIGCGKKSDFGERNFREVIKAAMHAIRKTKAGDICCFLTMLNVKERDIAWKIKLATQIAADCEYNFSQFKSKDERASSLKKVNWFVASKSEAEKCESAKQIGAAIAGAMAITKDLANTPPNVCHPTFMAKEAEKLAKKYRSVSFSSLSTKEMKNFKMGAFLSVAQGSVQPPKLITLEYKGAKKTQAPIALIGKGITFDTGGNSIKPADRMVGMKFDMCGAATVLGIIKFVADMKLPLNVVGIMACAENMPGGQASRPDDIVTTMSGQTVEILNTDAEGRLVLCEALTYCERYKPEVVIDVATLTGAAVVALGSHHCALMSNHQPLADSLQKAGLISGDRCWQLPLGDDYAKQLDSTAADFTNVGGPEAGTITAGCFLEKFARKFKWAHLDVAGTACKFTGKERGATGKPIPLLAQYLTSKCKYS